MLISLHVLNRSVSSAMYPELKISLSVFSSLPDHKCGRGPTKVIPFVYKDGLVNINKLSKHFTIVEVDCRYQISNFKVAS